MLMLPYCVFVFSLECVFLLVVLTATSSFILTVLLWAMMHASNPSPCARVWFNLVLRCALVGHLVCLLVDDKHAPKGCVKKNQAVDGDCIQLIVCCWRMCPQQQSSTSWGLLVVVVDRVRHHNCVLQCATPTNRGQPPRVALLSLCQGPKNSRCSRMHLSHAQV